MSAGTFLGLFLGALIGLLVWLFAGSRPATRRRPSADDQTDHETLSEAEREVAELDAFTSPDEADDELSDWGPGTPKQG